MQEKFYFLDFSVNSSDFIMNSDTAGGGRYKVSFPEFNFESHIDGDGDNMLKIELGAKVCGYPDGEEEPSLDETPVFEVNLGLSLLFTCSETGVKLDLEYYKENSWFFRNYITTSVKLATESILRYTPLHGLEMPWTVPE